MKALSIKQPWAAAIATGLKTIETRTWKTKYRGPILIVAGRSCDKVMMDYVLSEIYDKAKFYENLIYGQAIATATFRRQSEYMANLVVVQNGMGLSFFRRRIAETLWAFSG